MQFWMNFRRTHWKAQELDNEVVNSWGVKWQAAETLIKAESSSRYVERN